MLVLVLLCVGADMVVNCVIARAEVCVLELIKETGSGIDGKSE